MTNTHFKKTITQDPFQHAWQAASRAAAHPNLCPTRPLLLSGCGNRCWVKPLHGLRGSEDHSRRATRNACSIATCRGVLAQLAYPDQTEIFASMVASGFARPFPTFVCPTRPLQQLRVSCQQCAACHMLSPLAPHLACAAPSSNLYRLCHGSLTLLDTCIFGSYRASPVPSHLLKFIARVTPAMRCLPLAFSAHAAPRVR